MMKSGILCHCAGSCVPNTGHLAIPFRNLSSEGASLSELMGLAVEVCFVQIYRRLLSRTCTFQLANLGYSVVFLHGTCRRYCYTGTHFCCFSPNSPMFIHYY
jgi:hypothetical protein